MSIKVINTIQMMKRNEWFTRAHTTISGKLIACAEANEQFPFRHLLEEMSYSCWSKLYERGKTTVDVAVAFLESEYKALSIEMEEMEDHRREEEKDYFHGPGWYWVYSTDIRLMVEIDDDLPTKVPRASAMAEGWNWIEIDILFALMSIDRAIDHLEKAEACSTTKGGHMCCAATWALRASESFRLAMDWYPANDEKTHASNMGKHGADVKHQPNREARIKALEIFRSKEWPSRNRAAELIAPQVNFSYGTVRKWLMGRRGKKDGGAAS